MLAKISLRFSVFFVLVLPLFGCSATGFGGLKSCAPVYGNWCGKDYPSDEKENPPAVDRWDEACREHDNCYSRSTSKDKCDRRFVAKLEKLSWEELAPQRMHNAHSWLLKDGWVGGIIRFQDEIWAMNASCKGGDGRAAQFYCLTWRWSPWGLWPIKCSQGLPKRGRAGMPCICNGISGQIVEE